MSNQPLMESPKRKDKTKLPIESPRSVDKTKPSIESKENKKKTADKYTMTTGFVDGLSSVLGSFFMGAAITEMFSSDSDLALGAGMVMSVMALCSTYAHIKLNTHMQDNEIEMDGSLALSKAQYFALIGDYLSHAGTYAVSLIAGLDKLIEKSGFDLSKNSELAINIGLLAMSFAGAIGNVKTCANAMRLQNVYGDLKDPRTSGLGFVPTPLPQSDDENWEGLPRVPTNHSINAEDPLRSSSSRTFK